MLIYTDEGEDVIDIKMCSEHSVLKLIAFASQLIAIFGNGLVTYHTDRFGHHSFIKASYCHRLVQVCCLQVSPACKTNWTLNSSYHPICLGSGRSIPGGRRTELCFQPCLQ